MKLSIKTGDLNRAARLARNVRERSATAAQLAFVRLDASKRALSVSATDLVVDLVADVPAEVQEAGSCAVDVDVLGKIAAVAKDETIGLELDGSWLAVSHGRTRYRVPCMGVETMPRITSTKGAKLESVASASLAELLKRTEYAVCDDETRMHLCGVCLSGDGHRMRAVATDGHRLAIHEVDAPWSLPPTIIPARAVRAFAALLSGGEEAEVGLIGKRVAIRVDKTTITTAPIDMAFPPWEAVLPKQAGVVLSVDVAELRNALSRSTLMATSTQGVKLSLSERRLSLSIERPDGEYAESLDVDADGTFTVGLNPKYLLDWLARTPSDVATIAYAGDLMPIVTRDAGGSRGVVMPMRV